MRVTTPRLSIEEDTPSTPSSQAASGVRRSPTRPQQTAGQRVDPAVSVPIETSHSPAATATAEPVLEPADR